MPINPNYRPNYGAYGSTNPQGYDNETIAMMKQMGIWHPGMVTNKTLPGGHENPEYAAEQAAMQHILALREHAKGTDEVTNARTDARREYATQRADAAKLVEQGRNDRAAEMRVLREQAEKDRVNQGLIAAAHEELDPARQKVIMNEYYKRLGVTLPGVNDTKPVAGEYGPGAAKPKAPSPYVLPERTLIGGATQAPAGYDYNLNTGEFVRKDQPQFVNGQQVGGTAPPLRVLNPPPREEAGPTPVDDFYGIHTTTPVAGSLRFNAAPYMPNAPAMQPGDDLLTMLQKLQKPLPKGYKPNAWAYPPENEDAIAANQ
jgi:hypothetical protein